MSRPRSALAAIVLSASVAGCGGSNGSKLSGDELRYANTVDQLCAGMIGAARNYTANYAFEGLTRPQIVARVQDTMASLVVPFNAAVTRFDRVEAPDDTPHQVRQFTGSIDALNREMVAFNRKIQALRTYDELARSPVLKRNPVEGLNDEGDLPKSYYAVAPNCRMIADGKTPFM